MTTLALAGNPNCGKTTLFNALTGSRHHVGNWPGVTVERRHGQLELPEGPVEVVDLPGTYSLSAQSEDERIAADYLPSGEVDLILNVMDASNLERNLYLTSQLVELGKPVIFVLNMVDDAEKAGIQLNLPHMEALLGGPVVPTIGNREEGMEALRSAISASLADPARHHRPVQVAYGLDIEGEVKRIQGEIQRDEQLAAEMPSRWLALQLLEGTPGALERAEQSHARRAILAQVEASRTFLQSHLGDDTVSLIAEQRYGFCHGLVMEVQRRSGPQGPSFTARLDRVLTHRWLGIPLFVAVLVGVYALTFLLGKLPQDWISAGFEALRGAVGARLPAGELSSLVVDGIIPGVGAVVVFVPVIMILMGCIAFLEDTGYMARAAFIMDRLMHLMGLHGKSFIPLIMGTGCNVPAVQATRTLESPSDRLITILVTPLVSCSARLQVYIVLAAAFLSPWAATLTLIALHFLGFGLAMGMGRLLRSTVFSRDNAPFVMELPPYRLPVFRSTLIHMWEKGRVFLTRAGTTILAGATFIWFVSHYPGIADSGARTRLAEDRAAVERLALPQAERDRRIADLELAYQSHVVNTSLAARFGRFIQPALQPILDPDHKRPEAWKDGIALTAGFVAKEIVVSTMAVIHQAPEEAQGQGLTPLQQALRSRSGLTPLTAIAFMLFTLIYVPCLGTLSMTYKETRSLGWTVFTVGYGLVLGWFLAWGTVVVGRSLGF